MRAARRRRRNRLQARSESAEPGQPISIAWRSVHANTQSELGRGLTAHQYLASSIGGYDAVLDLMPVQSYRRDVLAHRDYRADGHARLHVTLDARDEHIAAVHCCDV